MAQKVMRHAKKRDNGTSRMNRLNGKRFWLVGASTGIGRELAIRLANEGVALVISARDEVALAKLLDVMSDVKTDKGGHVSVGCDVSNKEQVNKAFDSAGEIDGVIYCAGAYEPMSARNPDIEALETVVDVNLTGALRVLERCVPVFCSQGFGHIVLFGSISGYRGLPNAWGYGATKAALIHLAENLRCDLQNSKVLVQICNPGFVKSRLTNKNNFDMPFIMSPEKAADIIIRGMEKGKFEIAFPFVMVSMLKILGALPWPLYLRFLSMLGDKQEKVS